MVKKLVSEKVAHINQCVEVWACSGISRERAILREVKAILDAVNSMPDDVKAKEHGEALDEALAERDEARAEVKRLREALESLLSGPSLCNKECTADCGFAHLRGCDTIKEFLSDHRADLKEI